MLFVDSQSNIEREALRRYVFDQLTSFKKRADVLLFGDDHRGFWQVVHNTIALETDAAFKADCQKAEQQLLGLPALINQWIVNGVDSEQRFDFFIQTKANEFSGGDALHDYFWALQIRHDQLVALVRVLGLLIDRTEKWIKAEISELLNDPVFLGLSEYTIDEQVYLEAEKVHRERMHLIGGKP